MSFWFLFLFAYNFLQIFTFLLVWSLVLLMIFRLIVYFVYKRYPQNGLTFAVCVSTLITSALLFELLHQYHGSSSRRSLGRDINWFGPIWRLNPFYILTSMFGELIVVMSSVCGRSVSEYVSGVLRDQSWITAFVSVLLTVIVLGMSLFAITGYQINVGIQGITVSRTALRGGGSSILSKLAFKE
ncbi:hypothetical protein Aduo_010477 [Ancylostoma duodenale]